MTWGAENLRFARPVRWLVALLDSDILPLEVGGLPVHRVLATISVLEMRSLIRRVSGTSVIRR